MTKLGFLLSPFFIAAALIMGSQLGQAQLLGPGDFGCLPGLPCSTDPGTATNTAPGTFTKSSFSNDAGSRNYYVYVPKNKAGQTVLPLMVMLHGCVQTATAFAGITGMNDIAEKYGFVVVYPEQTSQDNSLQCWSWFKPESQTRDSGEPSIIVGIVHKLQNEMAIDNDHIFIAGMSAGGAMASNIIAMYSDIFAGAGIASGLEYKAATSEGQAWQVQSNGSSQDLKQSAIDAVSFVGSNHRIPAVFVIHGSSDTTVNPINSAHVVAQMTAINDLLDDGSANDSQNMTVISKQDGQVPSGHSYTTTIYGGSDGAHIEDVSVNGMTHAWSGAHQAAQYADQQGPDAAEMIWQFLWNNSAKK